MTEEEKKARRQERKAFRELLKDAYEEKAEREQRPIKAITITIEWIKSRTWGHNPRLSAEIEYKKPVSEYGGTFERSSNYTCSGCGYDKESTVIAQLFNDYLKYKLYQIRDKAGFNIETKEYNKIEHPYGIYIDRYISFNGGVGTGCYYRIAEFMNGKFEEIASGKSFDVYKYTDLDN